jgi:drug/metabolite transporter (DMT)-like permease
MGRSSTGGPLGYRYFLISLLCLFWGTAWFPIKVGLADLPPLTFMAARFLVATIVSLLPFLVYRVRLPRDAFSHRLFLQLGLFFFAIPYALVYWGMQYITSGLAAILFALSPMYTAMMAHLILPEERLNRKRMAGILLGFLGVLVIFSHHLRAGHPREFWGAAAVSLAPAFSSYAGILSKQQVRRYGALVLNAFSVGYGFLVMTALAFFLERGLPVHFTRASVESTLFLAIFGTVVTSLALIWLYQHYEATQMAMITYVTPIVALGAGYFLLGEVLSPQVWVGSGFVFGGIALVGGTGGRV